MKTPFPFPAALLVLLAATAGWFAALRFHEAPVSKADSASTNNAKTATSQATRKILFYRSAMHPWIKSDHPGKCTICGMELTPVFEGDSGITADGGTVTLSSNSISVLGVATTRVATGPLIRTLRVAGTIDDDDSRHRILSAYVGGRIEELYVNYVGSEVRAGQPLARFYSPMLLEAERQYLALSGGRTGTVIAPASDHALLHESAAERLRQLGLTPEQIAALPGKPASNHYTEILAPVSGTVVSRFVYPGQTVMEGEKLFELAEFSTMWFRFDAYEQDLPWLAVGQEVEVTTPSVPGQSFRAPIRFIDPNLVDMTRSTKVRVEIANPIVTNDASGPRRLLRHRLYAEGQVRVASPEVTLVPRSAVLSPDGHPVVYVDHSGGTYERRPIRLGRLGDSHYEVLSGLQPGESVVISGNLLIDAQAQLNLASQSGENRPPPADAETAKRPPLPRLTTGQTVAVASFLTLADTLRGHLAADDLVGFNGAAAKLHGAAEDFVRDLTTGTNSAWTPTVRALAATAHLPPASDLRTARQGYFPFSTALVEFARRLRIDGAPERFRELKIYQCPMTAEAFDGAPARAQWLQSSGPLRNPWFGKEMLECGVEVQQ